MPNSGLSGSFPLTKEGIRQNVSRVSPGAYALGRLKDGTFYINYVGRSDDDIADRLHDQIGKYPAFKFGYLESARAAFEKECHLYHDFDPPGNKVHPDQPTGANYECPRCTIFD